MFVKHISNICSKLNEAKGPRSRVCKKRDKQIVVCMLTESLGKIQVETEKAVCEKLQRPL